MRRLLPALGLALISIAPVANAQGAATGAIHVRWAQNPPGSRSWADSYFVSLPYGPYPGLPIGDIGGNTAAPDPCAAPDGVVDSRDAVCFLWGGGNPARRVGAAAISTWNASCEGWVTTVVLRNAFGVRFSGMAFPIPAGKGYLVNLAQTSSSAPPDYDVNLVSSCPAPFSGTTVASECPLPGLLLHVPYDTTYREWDEILCGERGVDWFDADGDGAPDDCPNGIFDGTHALTLYEYRWDPATGQSDYRFRRVSTTVFVPHPLFVGTNWPIEPGHAVGAALSPGHVPTSWDPPTSCP